MVLRAVFEENRNVEQLSLNSATIPDDAALTGNFSLELPAVEPKEHNRTYRLVIISEEDPGAAMCAVCLRVAGQCRTGGGPRVGPGVPGWAPGSSLYFTPQRMRQSN